MSNEEKPPIGLMPKNIYQKLRCIEITKAMRRYIEADKCIPEEWFDELRDIQGCC